MSRQTRKERLSADMARLGIERDQHICFGSPRTWERAVTVAAIVDRFKGGELIYYIAEDYGISETTVENALRFALRWPRHDLPSFWRNL